MPKENTEKEGLKTEVVVPDPADVLVTMTHASSDPGDYATATLKAFQEVWEPLGWKLVTAGDEESNTTNTGSEEGA